MTNKIMNKEQKEQKRLKVANRILWIPLLIVVALIPLIVRMSPVDIVDEKVVDVLNQTLVYDVYSAYKATAIVVVGVLMLLCLFLLSDKKMMKWDKTTLFYTIGGVLFIGATLLSTLLSKNRQVAMWGMPDRAEGCVVIICYILLIFYTFYSFQYIHNEIYLVSALGFLVVVSTIIGAFQFFGYDLFTQVAFFRNLILPTEIREAGASLVSDFAKGKVFGTMFHYNYMGSFGAMVVPFFLTLTLFIRNKWVRIGGAFLSICSLFLLFGSTSRAGLIGLSLTSIVALILLFKKLIQKWKISLSVVASLAVIVCIFNVITKGAMFQRVPTLIEDGLKIFASSDASFDYKDHIPVREIKTEEGKVKIQLQQATLYIGAKNNSPVFTDEKGTKVDYTMDQQGRFTTKDERFNKLEFRYEQVSNVEDGTNPIVLGFYYNKMAVLYMMVNDQKQMMLADSCPLEELVLEEAEAIGFKGKEKLGSARGYIWSRSIPLMKNSLLIGTGPDTYALHFPQDDLLAKWWAYDTPNMIVDKVHNLYMGMWINNGGLAVIGFFILIITYCIQCFKLYAFKGYYGNREGMGIAAFLAVVGYLGAGIFNDSVVAVTPVFCVILGTGMAINFLINKERTEIDKRLSQHGLKR